MAFPRIVKDRVVEHARRYKLNPVAGSTDTYDLEPVTGTVTEAGTPVNKNHLQPIEDELARLETDKETPAGAQSKVDTHANNTSNPHGVTTTQIGAETPTGAQTKANTAETNAKNASVAKAGDTMTGLLEAHSIGYSESASSFIPFPKGGSASGLSSTTSGAIKITLPVLWTNTMLRFAVDVYEYSTEKSFTVYLGGYNYSTSSTWLNTFAHIIGASGTNYTVRFGHDGVNACVWIGEVGGTWSYPKVFVRDLGVAHGNYAISTWNDGWSVSFVTALDTVKTSHNNSFALQDGTYASLRAQGTTKADVGLGNVGNYGSATASTANTHALRDSSGDINARLFKSEYDNLNASLNYFMTQIDTATNNYLRPASFAEVSTQLRGDSSRQLKTEVVSAFPAHADGKIIAHTGDGKAYVSIGGKWV